MQTQTNHQSGSRLLVVEADEAVRSALKRLLDKSGHEVQLASDACTGAVLLASGPVDLVILDLDTFADEGRVLCEQLCRPEAHYPVLVISRVADASDPEEACDIGGLLSKPVDPRVLLQAVSVLLRRSSSTSEVRSQDKRALALRQLHARATRLLRCHWHYRPLYY